MTSIWSNVAWLEDTSCHQVTLYMAQCLELRVTSDSVQGTMPRKKYEL